MDSDAQRQLAELQLIRCSLLPGELLTFLENSNTWTQLLDSYAMTGLSTDQVLPPARFQIKVDTAKIWFEVEMPPWNAGAFEKNGTSILVKGGELRRHEQERWQRLIQEKVHEVADAEYSIYELLSSHLLPILHTELEQELLTAKEATAAPEHETTPSRRYHALLTSHHLISPTKRRSLQQWSSALSITGFAKVGYPGVIYAQGHQEQVEEFVANIKAMQWLALKVRFLEPDLSLEHKESEVRWIEFQKVGEVVEEMRKIGKEEYVGVPGRQALSFTSDKPVVNMKEMCPPARHDVVYVLSAQGFQSQYLRMTQAGVLSVFSEIEVRADNNRSFEPSFRLSRGVINTISPPVAQAYKWKELYVPLAGRPLLDMSQGVPGIPPPKSLQIALGDASSSPSSFGYSSASGELSMRKSLAKEMRGIYGAHADVSVEDIALTAGCNMAFIAAIMSLADAGDDVILPMPWYFNHQMSLTMLGVNTVPLPTLPEDGFKPSIERCASLISDRTKAIVLVTPNNPTGATYPPSLIASFAKLARERNIALIIDETYRDFITSGSPSHELFSTPSWRNTFIHLFSFSKSYCIPGHRLGAIAASPELLVQIDKILDCLQICAPRPVQIALSGLLPSLRPFVCKNALALEARHALFRKELPENWEIGAQGGYFAFVKHPFVGMGSEEVSRRLAVEMGVVSLPAAFFCEESGEGEGGIQGRWIRFSVANVDDEKVKQVCERLRESETVFR